LASRTNGHENKIIRKSLVDGVKGSKHPVMVSSRGVESNTADLEEIAFNNPEKWRTMVDDAYNNGDAERIVLYQKVDDKLQKRS
jgi:hypothetical protein